MQRNRVASVAFVICLTLAGMAFPATAAGQSVSTQATTSTQAKTGYDWKRGYVGVNTGIITSTFQGPINISSATSGGTTTGSTTFPFSASNTSFTGGGQAGYNWVYGRLLIGAEASFNGMDSNGSNTVSAAFAASSANKGILVAGDSFGAHSYWVISLTPRVGYTWNKLLVYVTGGLSFANAYGQSNYIQTVSSGTTFPASSGSQSSTFTGGTIGGGAEYALREKWRVGGEYRYTSYGSANLYLGTVAAVATSPTTFVLASTSGSIGAHTNEFVIKLNRRF